MNQKKVFKTLLLISQLGISIVVPMFLLLYVGIIIKNKFNIDLVIIFIIVGIFCGIRNAYILLKNFISDNSDSSNELLEKHREYIKNKNK